MAKISQASAKYIIHAKIDIDGVVDRPDVVGAIFGQIEGLLGADLELRELQRSGRIGRIEVNVDSKNGKTSGNILIPSSLDKEETAIVGGALEIIERIGPCTAKLQVTRIEDERIAKRQMVIDRAKQLLKSLEDNELPDSSELSTQVSEGVKVAGVVNWGKDKLAAGPDIDKEEEIIFVEGRADVITLLRHGFKNVISVNGTSAPNSIRDLSKKKSVTLFTDGDRGGDLIINELMQVCKLDYIVKAPDGKEVEELQKKEIHQALRNRVPSKDWKSDSNGKGRGRSSNSNNKSSRPEKKDEDKKESSRGRGRRGKDDRRGNDEKREDKPAPQKRGPSLSDEEKILFKQFHKDVKGSKDALILDKKGELLGKVPVAELAEILPNLDGVSALITDTDIPPKTGDAIDNARVKYVICTGSKMRSQSIDPKEL